MAKGNAKLLLSPLLLFFSFIISGCLPSGSNTSSGSSSELVVWHWMTDRQSAFEQLAKIYEKETGIKVDFELYAPSDAYSQKVRAAAQGVNLPDIFGILGEKRDFASFIKAGHVMDLTPAMDADGGKWKAGFVPATLEANTFLPGNGYGIAPGVYGVPIDLTVVKFVYNKELLSRLGMAEPPATLDDLIRIGPKLREKNIQGLVSGWAEVWLIDCFAQNYAFNIMGKDKVMRTIKGEVPYTDPDWVAVFDVFRRMQQAGVLANGIVTMVNKTAEQLFANGKALFAFNGTWGVNVYKEMNPGLSYGVALLPKASDVHPRSFWGTSSSFIINARSSRREPAVKFLAWLTAPEQQTFLASSTNNLPANKDAAKDIPPVLAQFSADLELATQPTVWEVAEFPAVIEAFDKGIQSIIIGEKTPEQAASEVQRVKEREKAKIRQ